jgi:hypothetical protein
MSVDELVDLARGNVPGTPPFAVYSPDVVDGGGGARAGSGENEFDILKESLFYKNVDQLRTNTAEKFAKWRGSQAGGSKAGDAVSIPPRGR